MRILALVDSYLPGYKAGGPARTLFNMAEQLGNELHFKVVTRDRDFGDSEPYPDIQAGTWQKVSKADVFYIPSSELRLKNVLKIIRATEHDVLYLNSFFSPMFTIGPLLLRKLGLVSDGPVVLAPRGEFSPGALQLKNYKKKPYIAASNLVNWYEHVVWQASSSYEKIDIQRQFGDKAPIFIAPDLFALTQGMNRRVVRGKKVSGSLNLLFFSRVSRKKNLDGALRMLEAIQGQVRFDIYGPIEDGKYWRECQTIIDTLPSNVQVRYFGAIPHEQVVNVMSSHDLLLMPTLGENFGHVIPEALLSGCPVLISDRTPWRGLEQRKAGWDIPLGASEEFRSVLQQCVTMDDHMYREWSQGAADYGFERVASSEAVKQNKELFRLAVSR